MLHCSQYIYVLFSNREMSIYVFISARSQVKANFSGQSEHNHFSHLLAFVHHEGFFCLFVCLGFFIVGGCVCVLMLFVCFVLKNPNTIEINA